MTSSKELMESDNEGSGISLGLLPIPVNEIIENTDQRV
jgi:hypothetical protein